jgi:polar amino acid transport system substrate-binding protein
VNPVWFGDAARTRYIWSAALFTDEDLVILRPGLRLDYQNISSLRGLTLGGVIGHVYADADPEVAAGRMRREDAISMEHTLRKLLLGRVDVAFLSRSGLRWWAGQLPDLRTSASAASQPRQRHLLLSPRMPAQTRNALLQAVLDMPRNSLWRAMLERHGLRAD